MMEKTVKPGPDLDTLSADASRILHLTQAALNILDELPFADAEGKRIRAMDQLWALLSSMEIQAQLHVDTVEDAISTLKRRVAA